MRDSYLEQPVSTFLDALAAKTPLRAAAHFRRRKNWPDRRYLDFRTFGVADC